MLNAIKCLDAYVKCLDTYADFTVGDTVYIYHSLVHPVPIIKGEITKIKENHNRTISFLIKWMATESSRIHGESWTAFEHVFKTRDAALIYWHNEKQIQKNRYKMP